MIGLLSIANLAADFTKEGDRLITLDLNFLTGSCHGLVTDIRNL